jgi:hypothetical protein
VRLVESTTDPVVGTDYESLNWPLIPDCSSNCFVGTIAFNVYPNNADVQNIAGADEDFGPSISNAFVINWDIENSTDPNAFVINNYLDNAFVINAFVINSGDPNAFVINDGVDNAFVINNEVQNAFVINSGLPVYDITDTVWTMTADGSNTAGTYIPLINVDNAAQLQGYYAWQLIVDKNSAYGGLADACASYNVAQQQVLANVVQNPGDPNAFVINDFVENAFVINQTVDNAFVINSAFAIPPAPGDSSESMSMKSSPIGISGTGAPPPSSEVRITLRAFQLVPDELLPLNPLTGVPIKHNPAVSMPSISVFHEACGSEEGDDCIETAGADLVIDSIDTTPIPGEPCGEVTFPAFTLRNQGTADAVARDEIVFDQNGEPQINPGRLRHAIFLSEGDDVLEFGVDMPLEGTEFFSVEDPLSAEFDPRRIDPEHPEYPLEDPFTDPFESRKVQLPADLDPAKTYYLILWVDYPRQASESDETNNTVAIELDLNYGLVFEGLKKPLLDIDSITGANAGSVVPLQWQYLDPITLLLADSSTPDPVVTFRGWFDLDDPDSVNCSTYAPTPDRDNWQIEFTDNEDPGASDLRYDLGVWIFNWQGKWPEGSANAGDPLPPGCYEITISRGDTECDAQTAGPFKTGFR